jgi:hypothetical protein
MVSCTDCLVISYCTLNQFCGTHYFDADLNPVPTFPFEADPACPFDADPDRSNRLIFYTFWLAICKVIRIRFPNTVLNSKLSDHRCVIT